MPALAPVPSVARFRFEHTIGSELRTGWHAYIWYGGTPPSGPQATATAQTALTAWGANLKALHSPAVVLSDVIVLDLSASTAAEGIASGAVAGTRVGGQLPANTALLLNWQIARRYRGGHPRAYVPAGVETDLATPQTWTTAFTTAFMTGWNSMWGQIFAGMSWATGPKAVAVSYWQKGEWKDNPSGRPIWKPYPRPGGPLVDDITQTIASTTIGSQRRRLHPG